MRIYTEVNYIWKDNKLVQTDSKSFDYEGDVDKCDKKWYRHNHALTNAITGGGKKLADYGKDVVTKAKDTVAKGPGGTAGQVVDAVYGGSTKDAVESVQQTYRDFEGGVQNIKNQIMSLLGYGEGGDEEALPSDNPLLEEDTEAGSRGTASGGKYRASGRSTTGRRGIVKKNMPKSIINQQMQKRLYSSTV